MPPLCRNLPPHEHGNGLIHAGLELVHVAQIQAYKKLTANVMRGIVFMPLIVVSRLNKKNNQPLHKLFGLPP